jgi:pimeloyl-ACP methyl ester carboxylesterase
MHEPDFRDLFVTSTDGLKLYARDYGPPVSHALPVVCLPGLARTSADFHDLACALSRDPECPRRVLCLDYRGRGRSDRDPAWQNYDVRVEMGDVLAVLVAAGIEEAAVVGTSRGGLIAMALSAARPALLRAVVLNDVGPVIDGKGLVRIRSYIGKLPKPRDHGEAVEILKGLMSAQFPKLTPAEWEGMARTTWTESKDGLVPAYDPKLMTMLESLDLEAPLPILWGLFEGLKTIPVLALRGANSDILSADTFEAMQAAHPALEAVTVADQGHAPLLTGGLIDTIRAFLNRIDA